MKRIRVLNLGGGVQSSKLRMTVDHDVAIFADTGEEPDYVYEHLKWLKQAHKAPLIIASAGGRLGDHLMIGKNSTGGRFASIPAFTGTLGSKQGITRRQCTKEYKLEPIARAIRREVLGLKARQHIPKDVEIVQIVGISLDEAGRSVRIQRRYDEGPANVSVEFPLVQAGETRADCVDYLEPLVPHKVRRSACSFCPYMEDHERAKLQQLEPATHERACQVDDALRIPGNVVNRNMDQSLYIHQSCVPLREIDFSAAKAPQARTGFQIPMTFNNECDGMCGH